MTRTESSHEATARTIARGGTYTSLFQLAAGGMGTVHLAIKQEGTFRRLYAVKRLHAHLRNDSDFQDMFLDEARVAGMVRHPSVVGVIDYGQDEEGPFLVMDYVDGVSLGRLMKLVAKEGAQLPIQVCLRIMLRVGEGLRAAHELRDSDGNALRLVHRDLSPQNVLVSFDGAVMLTDFGIAKALGSSSKTATGVLKGKMGYMSPEQLRFQTVDHRSDLFSFGVVLHELLSGERLYKNRTQASAAQRILHEPVGDIGELRPDAPPALVELLFRLLAKDREHRPDSARQVVEELEVILADEVVSGMPIRIESVVSRFAGDECLKRREQVQEAITASEKQTIEPQKAARPIGKWIAGGAAAVGLVALGAFLGGQQTSTEAPDGAAVETPEEVIEEPTAAAPPAAEELENPVPEEALEELANVEPTPAVEPSAVEDEPTPRPRPRVRAERRPTPRVEMNEPAMDSPMSARSGWDPF